MSTLPKLGIMLPLGSGKRDRVFAIADEAEELGFDGVFAFDHFYAPGTSPDHPALEALMTLAAVAARTERVQVGTLVLRVGVRAPGLLAKMAAQLHDASSGRFILGLGAGDEAGRDELAIYGIPDQATQEERWVLLQETVHALHALFDGEVWEGGERTPRLAGPLLPPPEQTAGPPVWVGGMSHAARHLAATEADGWNAWGVPEEVFADRTVVLRREADAAERACAATWAGVAMVGEDAAATRAALDARLARGQSDDGLWVGSKDDFASFLLRMGAAGAAWVIVAPAGSATKLTTLAAARTAAQQAAP